MTCPPVLFIIFNRPDTTAKVFEAIRAAAPSRLYVAADGPRSDRPGEAALCNDARSIATAVDWPCTLKTLFRDSNLGCGDGPRTAIDWFFEQENEGIILEDDCLPSPQFFPFCKELLDRYRADHRIMAVCGSNYAPKRLTSNESYYFSYFPDIWGWATWRRAWNLYDRNLTRWSEFKSIGHSAPLERMPEWRYRYWKCHFDLTEEGKEVDWWDYQWIFTVLHAGGLACYPTRNLVSNLGFRPDATHTKVAAETQSLPSIANLPVASILFPLTHPKKIVRNERMERSFDMARFGIGPRPTYLTRAYKGFLRRIRRAVQVTFN